MSDVEFYGWPPERRESDDPWSRIDPYRVLAVAGVWASLVPVALVYVGLKASLNSPPPMHPADSVELIEWTFWISLGLGVWYLILVVMLLVAAVAAVLESLN